jgi:hypothetical protein
MFLRTAESIASPSGDYRIFMVNHGLQTFLVELAMWSLFCWSRGQMSCKLLLFDVWTNHATPACCFRTISTASLNRFLTSKIMITKKALVVIGARRGRRTKF